MGRGGGLSLGAAALALTAAVVGAAPKEAETKKAAVRARKPASAAERLFWMRCSTCHDPKRVFHRRASRGEWQEIVDRMRRMPQSGIAPEEGRQIVDFLAGLRPGTAVRRAPKVQGGPLAYGKEWLAVLEVDRVRDGRARLLGRTFRVQKKGTGVVLTRKKRSYEASLSREGAVTKTARYDRWRVGRVTYERHLVLYRKSERSLWVGVALKRIVPSTGKG